MLSLAMEGMSFQSELPVAMEPDEPHFCTSWLVKGAVSSAEECPCWVKIRGRERDLKVDMRVRILGREEEVIGRKNFCMSMMRRAVREVAGGDIFPGQSHCR